MLRRILFCFLAIALLHASPGFHAHEHAGESTVALASHDEDDGHDDTNDLCVDCMLQAQQAAPAPDAADWRAAARAPAGPRHSLYVQALPRAPPGGAIRVRGPPLIGS